ncbi:MAG: type II toxin-antitoxin system PemK/MazF family toxin, partial [Patescibacteria group bacterium]
CSIGHNVGVEQNGSEDNFSRPVLVVKKFNNQMFWIVPLSTKQKSYDFYFNFTDPDGKKVSLVLAQLKLVSIKRFKRKIYKISIKEFDEIKSKIVKFVE